MGSHVDVVTGEVVDAAVRLHRRLGPGLLETVYQTLLGNELERRGLGVQRQKRIEFEFEGVRFQKGLRVDLLLDRIVVVEVKAVETLANVHWKQVLTYLRLLNLRVGLLVNFGGATLKEGLHRVVNNYRPPDADASPRLDAPPRLRVKPG